MYGYFIRGRLHQVECNDKICRGKGPNKKLAKRSAAEEMLLLMGYSKPSPVPVKSVLKSSDSTHSSAHHMNKHVTFSDTSSKNSKVSFPSGLATYCTSAATRLLLYVCHCMSAAVRLPLYVCHFYD